MASAASAVASSPDAADLAAPSLRFHLITAGVLLGALAVLYGVFELSRPEKILIEGPLEMPSRPSSAESEAGDAEVSARAAEAVRFTPELEIDGPTTLVFEMTREATDGWVGVAIALVNRDSAEVRQLALGTEWMPSAEAGSGVAEERGSGSLEARARVDEVESGRYVVRLAPAWEPVRQPLPGPSEAEADATRAPRATIRIRQERRSPLHFWLAAALVTLPAVVQFGRWLWYTRRRRER